MKKEEGRSIEAKEIAQNVENRLYQFVKLDLDTVKRVFEGFRKGIDINRFTPIHKGMSTSNFAVHTGAGKFLLKLYTNPIDGIECAMYRYLSGKVSVPELYYYDDRCTVIPYRYAILQFIEGETLNEFIIARRRYPLEQLDQIARALAVIHGKKYDERGLLNNEFRIKETFSSTLVQTKRLLEDKAGNNLSKEAREKAVCLVDVHGELFSAIETAFVLSHGDFSYGNLIVDRAGKVWFIDFEYALSANRFHDIAKFFRRKSDEVEACIGQEVFDRFRSAYNGASGNPLPGDFKKLIRIEDIPAMLALINRDDPPNEWVEDISRDIVRACDEAEAGG